MGQKVHPNGFRLGISEQHNSTWYASSGKYAKLVKEEQTLRKTLLEIFKQKKISKIKIEYKERSPTKESQMIPEVTILTPFPRSFFGTGANKGKLNSIFQKELDKKIPGVTEFKIEQSGVETQDAKLIAEFIGNEIESRKSYRRAIKIAIQKAKQSDIQGIKIQVSGRLNGIEMARREWTRVGRVPLQTLRERIDYHCHEAQTTYGILGIQVWVCNPILENDKSKLSLKKKVTKRVNQAISLIQ